MTITLDNRPEIPIHPLDLTGEPPQDSASQYCVGLIQTADAQLTNPSSDTGDMILGVPFLRNVYTVMAYDPPNADGTFDSSLSTNSSLNRSINPRLGLLNLTDPTVALDEFQRVRLLNQPLTSPHPPPSNNTSTGRKLSVGIDVLIGLVSFVVFCFILFATRWFFGEWMRRKSGGTAMLGNRKSAFGSYRLARRGSKASLDGQPSEDALRKRRFEVYMNERMNSEYTTDSARTRVNSDLDLDLDAGADFELGYRKPKESDSNPPPVDPWDDTLVTSQAPPDPVRESMDSDRASPPLRSHAVAPILGDFRRPPAQRTQSVSLPLLVHERDGSRSSEEDLAEFGVAGRSSMAGIGTAARGSRIDPALRQGSIGSLVNVFPSGPTPSRISPPRRMPSGPRPLTSDGQQNER